MNTLLHLCKKDFTFAKPWILGTWFAFAISNLLPWISPDGKAGEPFMLSRLLAPVVMVFLTSTRIIHCDSFVGTAGFMGTRPVRPTTLLRNKLLLIAFVLVLPAVGFALLHAACLRVNLSALEWLLLFIENWLYFSLIAGAAVAYAVISRNVGIMVIFVIATPFLFLMLLAMFNLNWPFGESLEEQHLKASFQLVAQAFLSVAAVAIAMSWVAKRRIWLTAAGFLLCAAFLAAPGLFWKWNFVEVASKKGSAAEIVSERVSIQWTNAPKFGSYKGYEDTIHSKVSRAGLLAGLEDGWTGDLVKFRSVAQFKDGAVWQSEGASKFISLGDFSPNILAQLGIDVAEEQLREGYGRPLPWTLFEYERTRSQPLPDLRASLTGIGTFQLERPVILAELPAKVGASIVSGRFRYRIEYMSTSTTQISLALSTRGIPLISLGDSARQMDQTTLILANPGTQEFATSMSGSSELSGTSRKWNSISQSFSINQQPGSVDMPVAGEFIKGARLYIIGKHYGGNIKLPYEIPEMLLEEKR